MTSGAEQKSTGARMPVGVRTPTYAAGIVNYGTYDDVESCLASLQRQTVQPCAVVVADCDPDQRRLRALQPEARTVVWKPILNRGFAGGANAVLREIEHNAPAAEFALLLNPDVTLEPGFAEHVLNEVARHTNVALATGKLLRPGGRTIDSAGIVLPRHRRPRDRGSGQPDRGQYDRSEFIFGASGGAMMIRRSALSKLELDGEVFDEDFFMYHEDTDLSWRTQLLGWRVLYVPTARAFHVRRWRREVRFEIPVEVRRHSFKNHYLQLIKNERLGDFLVNVPVLLAWELLRLGFALFRDREVLPAYRDAWRLCGAAWSKRRKIHDRARPRGLPALRSIARGDTGPRLVP